MEYLLSSTVTEILAWADNRVSTPNTPHGGQIVTGYPRTVIRLTDPDIRNTIHMGVLLIRTQVTSQMETIIFEAKFFIASYGKKIH